jgi:alcohol dehydrogenase
MEIGVFSFSAPRIVHFGAGSLSRLAPLLSGFGRNVLIVHGKRTEAVSSVRAACKSRPEFVFFEWEIPGEPCPEDVDAAVASCRGRAIDVVLSVGGGSVIDGGKAVSAMLPLATPVNDYLEDVGAKKHPGTKVPFVAVPTTAGTGAEATKNAVISRIGPHGFKKSLRHDNFMPDAAIIDPGLTASCPPGLSAACGMDALSQLLESYVSTKASPMTDALGHSGLRAIADSLVAVCSDRGADISVRSRMSYAAIMSGITLANAGLGIVHGFASAIGGLFCVPHGVVCGTLLAACMKKTMERLKESGDGMAHLEKFSRAGMILCGRRESSVEKNCERLIGRLEELTSGLSIPRLGAYGIAPSAIGDICAGTDNKNNPARLDRKDMAAILLERI